MICKECGEKLRNVLDGSYYCLNDCVLEIKDTSAPNFVVLNRVLIKIDDNVPKKTKNGMNVFDFLKQNISIERLDGRKHCRVIKLRTGLSVYTKTPTGWIHALRWAELF